MIYAEVTDLQDRYRVDIHPEDLFLESQSFDSIHGELNALGYLIKDEIRIDDETWHFILSEPEVNEKAYSGYGLVMDYWKVYDVVAVLDSGRSKDGKHLFPVPGSDLAKDSKQIKNLIIYQNKDYHVVWSQNKNTLDVLRKRVIEWRRNHSFKIDRLIP